MEHIFAELRNLSCIETDYYQFYTKCALEAFQYEAESGSIKPIKWMLELLSKLKEFISVWDRRYVIFVFVGFTFYNFARNINFRYGVPEIEFEDYFLVYDRFYAIVKKFDIAHTDVQIADRKHLVCFAEVISHALATSNANLSQDESMRSPILNEIFKKLVRFRNVYQVPDIIFGLHLHHQAKLHYLNGSVEKAWENFDKAIRLLSTWDDCEASRAVYLYDALCGK